MSSSNEIRAMALASQQEALMQVLDQLQDFVDEFEADLPGWELARLVRAMSAVDMAWEWAESEKRLARSDKD